MKTLVCFALLWAYHGASAQLLNTHDVIITELMIDPDPPVGLPTSEYIELYNRSDQTVDLSMLTIADRSRAVQLPSYPLAAQSYVLLVQGFAEEMPRAAIELSSWPTLNNTGDRIQLSASDQVLHVVEYTPQWYRSSLKESGGWSLEMIDWGYPCSGPVNWSASEDVSGGTPGYINSIAGSQPDRTPPQLLSIQIPQADSVVLQFDQPLLPESVGQILWDCVPSLSLDSLWASDAFQPYLHLKLRDSMTSGIIYEFRLAHTVDCNGNIAADDVTGLLALPQKADSADVVINEIMFEPPALGSRYLEIINRSQKVLDLKNWSWSKMENQTLGAPHFITKTSLLLFPEELLVFTESLSGIQATFEAVAWDRLWEIDLPSMAGGNGTVALLDESRSIVDLLYFNSNMHHELLVETQGIALERISPDVATNDPNNWLSAPQQSGFGSPGFINGQAHDPMVNSSLTLSDAVFNPFMGSGYLGIYYQFPQVGNTINLWIFDYTGHRVKTLIGHSLTADSGMVFWDGTDDQKQLVTSGVYVVFLRQRDRNGRFNSWKSSVVVAHHR